MSDNGSGGKVKYIFYILIFIAVIAALIGGYYYVSSTTEKRVRKECEELYNAAKDKQLSDIGNDTAATTVDANVLVAKDSIVYEYKYVDTDSTKRKVLTMQKQIFDLQAQNGILERERESLLSVVDDLFDQIDTLIVNSGVNPVFAATIRKGIYDIKVKFDLLAKEFDLQVLPVERLSVEIAKNIVIPDGYIPKPTFFEDAAKYGTGFVVGSLVTAVIIILLQAQVF